MPKKSSFKSDEAYEKALEASRKWKRENVAKVRAQSKKWSVENPERKKELKAAWDVNNPEARKFHMDKLKTKRPDYFKDKHLQYQYGISIEEYSMLAARQDNKCATCGKPAEETHRKRLFVDHCHSTGKIRGLLCQQCNTALGMVNDDISKLSALISYLMEHDQNE